MSRFGSWTSARCRIGRMFAVARLETLRLVRDRVAISLIVLVPAVQIALFGYAVNLDPKHVRIAVAGTDGAPFEQAARVIGESGYFDIVALGLPPGGAETMVLHGEAQIGLELPSTRLSAAELDADTPEEAAEVTPRTAPTIFVDAAEPAAVRPALSALESTYWRFRSALLSPAPRPPVRVEWLFNPDRRTDWTILPGLTGVIVMISMLMLGALTLVRERERGTWEALLASPIDAFDALAGKLAPYVLIGTAQGAIAIGLGTLLFGLPKAPGVAALLTALPAYAVAHLILGFALSAVAESQMQAVQAAVFFYLPSMLLSGFMFPFDGMPRWARSIGEVLPLTHFVRASRGVLLKGQGFNFVAHQMWPVAIFCAGTVAVALLTYRRRLD